MVFLNMESLDCIICVRSRRRWRERLSKDASWTQALWRRNANVILQASTPVSTVGRLQLSRDSLNSPNQWRFVLQNAKFVLLGTF